MSSSGGTATRPLQLLCLLVRRAFQAALAPVLAMAGPTRTPSAPESARYSVLSKLARGAGVKSEVCAFPQFGQRPADKQVGPGNGLSAARAGGELFPGPVARSGLAGRSEVPGDGNAHLQAFHR